MATAYENNMSCAVCLELYDDPRFLPCGHSYCFKCLLDLQNKSLNKSLIKCPICQAESSSECGGEASYTKNYELNSLVQSFILESKTNDTSGVVHLCDICDICDPPVQAQRTCTDCDVMYCETCFKTCHPLKGNLGKHKIVNIDGEFKCAKDTKSDDRSMYCNDCDTLISAAGINSHNKHDVVSLDKAYSNFKVKLEEANDHIDLNQLSLKTCLDKSKEKLKSIASMFDEIEREVSRAKEEMLAKVGADVKEAEAAIDNLMPAILTHKDLQTQIDMISFVEECEDTLRRSTLKDDFNDVEKMFEKIDGLSCSNTSILREIRKFKACFIPVPISLQFDHEHAGSYVRISRDGRKISIANEHAYQLHVEHYHESQKNMAYSNMVLGTPRMEVGRIYWELEMVHTAGEPLEFGVTSSVTPEDCDLDDDTSWIVRLNCDRKKLSIGLLNADQCLHKEDCATTSDQRRYGLLLDINKRTLSVFDIKKSKDVYTFTNVDTCQGITSVFVVGDNCTMRLVDPDEFQRTAI